MTSPATIRVQQAVGLALGSHERVVLAVSGGLDSMVLLHAAGSTIRRDRLIVATFDHATGAAATEAATLVETVCEAFGVSCRTARAASAPRGEAALREARWGFLRHVGEELDAAVCTAHTEDDQLETVTMRILRGAGARGLAALYADAAIVRPLIGLRRETLASYAREQGIVWVEDPTNRSPTYLRNRVRSALLPALREVAPRIDVDLLAIARRAAEWRLEVEALASRAGARTMGRGIDVPARSVSDADTARLLWPVLAARVGVILDRRGIERLARFSESARVGARIQLSGGWQVVRSRTHFELRTADVDVGATSTALRVSQSTRCGNWAFRVGNGVEGSDSGAWAAWLPTSLPLTVRPWQAGDFVEVAPNHRTKVKRLLSSAGVTGHIRAGWPVVLQGDRIVWVPGVSRADAAAARPGRPGLVFLCEYIHR